MLSMEHEAPVELFREHPEVVPSLLERLLGVQLPYYSQVQVTDPGTRTLVPTGKRSDAAVVLWDGKRPVLGVVLEPQGKIDEDKLFAWPKYLSDMHAELRCRSYLVVLALTRSVARWAREPIPTLQPGRGLSPYVVGPDDLPRLETAEQAKGDLWLGALAALLHAGDEQGSKEALVALRAAREVAGDRQAMWLYELLRAIMTPERYRRLEEFIMLSPESYLPKTDWERQQFGRGKAEGKAESLVRFLVRRHHFSDQAAIERIQKETRTAVLDGWLDDAIMASDEQAIHTLAARIRDCPLPP